MKKTLPLLLSILCIPNALYSQGICNEAGNIILYSNYDGGNIQINIDEDVPDIKIGICSYESVDIIITGDYIDNVSEVVYAGYDDDGTTSISGVDPGIVDINVIPEATLTDPDGYPYIICAYECDTDYVPGGCNTVDQLTDYFLDYFTGIFRFSFLQYGVWTEDEYSISEGGNCCFDGEAAPSPVDLEVVSILAPADGCNLSDEEIISVTIKNNGPVSVESIPLNISVDAAPPSTETAFLTLESGESGDYTFTTTADLASAGLHTILVYTSLAGDPDDTNNSLTENVQSFNSPELDLPDNLSACGELILDAENSGSNYLWNTGATSQTIVVTESGIYSVTITDPVSGCEITESTDVEIKQFPIASFTYLAVGLNISFTNTSTEADSYLWDFGDSSPTSSDENPMHSYPEAGEFTITLSVTNECGTDTYSTVVQITTALSDIYSGTSFMIYPNPTSGNILIRDENLLNKQIDIKLLDVLGEEIQTLYSGISSENEIHFNLSYLENAIYVIEINSEDQKIISSFMIIK